MLAHRRRTHYWVPPHQAIALAVAILIGLGIMLYPDAAAWQSQARQSEAIRAYKDQINHVEPDKQIQLDLAHQYNDQLRPEAIYEPNTNIPKGRGLGLDGSLKYEDMLRSSNTPSLDTPMARLMIPHIDLDLPVYHGTSDDTLKKGLGHLEGTSLPVGGKGTRSVITGHRGMAEAELFTRLNEVVDGDMVYVDVFGEVLRYQVFKIQVIEPEDTEAIKPDPDEDLLTLITCTPLGINTQRILVTARRSEPVSDDEIDRANRGPEIPRFPWFALWFGLAAAGAGLFVWWTGRKLIPPVPAREEQEFPRSETVGRIANAAIVRGNVLVASPRRAGVTYLLLFLLPEVLHTVGEGEVHVINVLAAEHVKLLRGRKLVREIRRLQGMGVRLVVINGFHAVRGVGKVLRTAKKCGVTLVADLPDKEPQGVGDLYEKVWIDVLSFEEFVEPEWQSSPREELWGDYSRWGGYPGVWAAKDRDEYVKTMSKAYVRVAGVADSPGVSVVFPPWCDGRKTPRLVVDPGMAAGVGLHSDDGAQQWWQVWLVYRALEKEGLEPRFETAVEAPTAAVIVAKDGRRFRVSDEMVLCPGVRQWAIWEFLAEVRKK